MPLQRSPVQRRHALVVPVAHRGLAAQQPLHGLLVALVARPPARGDLEIALPPGERLQRGTSSGHPQVSKTFSEASESVLNTSKNPDIYFQAQTAT